MQLGRFAFVTRQINQINGESRGGRLIEHSSRRRHIVNRWGLADV